MTILLPGILPALVALGTVEVWAQPAADAMPTDWRAKVTAAKMLDDEVQKKEALVVLVREALGSREVRLSGAAHAKQVHPEDNQPAPIVNFDVRLNQKMSAPLRSGAESRSLQGNFGYYFSTGGKSFVVLGPAALDPRSPAFTRLAAEHELFHAEHHVGDGRPMNDRELEAWSHMFVRYFHEMAPFRQRWAPMLGYYEEAESAERRRAIERLADYYRSASTEGGRIGMRDWLEARRSDSASSVLVRDLDVALSLKAPLAPAASTPVDSQWEKKVKDASALTDEAKKAEAMLALVREALKSSDVQPSGNAHPEAVHPDDNKAAPAIGFDGRLNQKNGYRTGKQLETNSAYYFVAGGEGFIVLGPRSLDARSPVFTRMFAAHESFHAKHHIGDPRPLGDRELETWTHVFVTFFHEVHPFKQKWSPLVTYYETSDPGEQKATLDKLVDYYRQPLGDAAAVRVAFNDWLARRKKDAETSGSALVSALERALRAE